MADSNVFISGMVVPKRRSTLFDQAVSIPEPSQVSLAFGRLPLSVNPSAAFVFYCAESRLRFSNTEAMHCC